MKMAEQRNGLLLLAWAACFLLACIFAGCAGDVPDGVVYTDLHKTVKKGDSATLKCEFRGEPIAVYWRKEIGKDQWTDLITWVEGTMLPGSCLADDSCEMNQDYSLIINHVQIADGGRYMCRISNYLGILIHNYTDVTVYAPPEDPYPIIKECTSAENQPSAQRCSIPASDTPMDITCSASSFFPELNLFFLHGSEKVINTGSKEWTNENGTKNKSISIQGSRSEIPYVCVASDIPGSTDERTATVFLLTVSTPRAPERTSYPSQTTMASDGRTDEANGTRPAKIAVPIIIIALAGGTLLIVCWWLKRCRNPNASREKDVEEAQPMIEKIKVHVEGVVSYYELWSLAYNTPKQDMGKVCGALKELDMEIRTEEIRREHVYNVLCRWKEKTKKLNQAQIFRDALESAELGNRWHQIYGKRRETTPKVSEGTLEQILLDLEMESPKKINNFLDNLISKGETDVDITKEKDVIVPNTEQNSDNAEEERKPVAYKESNVDGEDDKSDDVSDAENYGEVSDAQQKNDAVQEAMRKLREWNKGPFNENPYVLLSLALERAGCIYVARTIFDGVVSFYELRSLLYNMESPDMKKLHNLIKELGEVEDMKSALGPQQIYDIVCRWKENHNKGDQAKLLRDALDRADLSEAWFKIPETRQNTARVSWGTLKHILLEIKDPIKIQQFMGKLVRGTVRHQNASDDKDVISQALNSLKKWNKGPFDENPMILLSRALESGGCSLVDRTFFYGTISYFELWSLVHSYKDDMKTLGHALHSLGLQERQDTKLNQVYLLLCEWKNQHHACDQLLALKMLLVEAGLNRFCEDLQERRYRTNTNISECTLEHILWHVKEPNKINNFLRELSQDLREPGLDVGKPIRDIVRAALEKLKQWKEGAPDENQVVHVSLALERACCNPVDRTFFKIPVELQAPIEQAEVEIFVHKLTNRHCKRLANGLPKVDENRILEIPDENNDVLFDTKSMIRDWIANVECSNYEKRCRLDDAVINIGRHDITDPLGTISYRRRTEEQLTQLPHRLSECFNHDTIFDDDLISLAKMMKCLNPGIMTTFCTSVGISEHVKEGDKSHPLEQKLRDWRDRNLTSKSKNCSLESVFSLITELMGDKSYVKYVTDEEFGFIKTQLKADDKKFKFLSGLHIHRDEKKGTWKLKGKGLSRKEKSTEGEQDEEGKEEVEAGKGEDATGKGADGAGKGEDGTGKGGDGIGKDEGGAGKEEDGAGKEVDVAGKDKSEAGKEGDEAVKEGDGAGKGRDGAVKDKSEAGKEGDGAVKEGDGAGKGRDGPLKGGGGAGKEGDGALKEGNGAGKGRDGALKGGDGAGKGRDGALKERDGAGKGRDGALKEGDGVGKGRDGALKEGDGAGKGRDGAGKADDKARKKDAEAGKDENEEEAYVPNVKDTGVDSVFVDLLKEWRNRCGEKSCRKKLRTLLKTIGKEECIVNKTPRKYMYKAELVQVAFNILMIDVLPVMEALGIDQRKVWKYKRQNPDLEKGCLSLLMQLCHEGNKTLEAYNRRDFLPTLLKFGYVDAAKLLYLDYQQSLSELSSIVSRLDKIKFQAFITQLGISPGELPRCKGTDEEAYRIEVMRIWKSTIRPVPYHYRMHIVTALQSIGCRDLASEVLSGHHRVSAATDDVIRAICSRSDSEQIKRLCTLLKLKPDEDQRTSTGTVVRWVNNWMDEYDPFPKVIKGKSLDKFLQRKHQNNELLKAGFYELAQEIMTLEFSRF